MFGSVLLEIFIGLAFVYLLLAVICSALSEWIARIFAMRSKNLEAGIRNLLQDPGLVEELYQHPLLKSFYRQGWFDKLRNRRGGPSYIPSRAFALALLDIAAPADPQGHPKDFEGVRDAVDKCNLLSDKMKTALLVLIDEAAGDLRRARENIENWFDDTMNRVSGWYKRKAQLVVLLLALVLSVALNADTITIANSLSSDTTLRAAVVAAAEETAKERPIDSKTPLTRVNELRNELEHLGLPIGWLKASERYVDPREVPTDAQGWFYKILGLLLTTIAVSLGAPFWFDLLNKFVNLRGAGKESDRISTGKGGRTEVPGRA
jgi:hypothetical protein